MSSHSRIPPRQTKPQATTTLPPLEMLTGYRRNQPILSSSPARSSSPPRTPYLAPDTDRGYGGGRYYQPYIQSSPTMDGGVELPPLRFKSDDPPSIWVKARGENHLPASLNHATIGRPSTFYHEYDLPPSSESEVPELDSETTSPSTPGHAPSLSFSDSDSAHNSINAEVDEEGMEEEEEEEYGYGYSWRATFFSVSEERGRWKDDPDALDPATTAGLSRPLPPPQSHSSCPPSSSITKRHFNFGLSRQSMPLFATHGLSREPSVGLPSATTRTISEPLASTSLDCGDVESAKDDAHTRGKVGEDAIQEQVKGEVGVGVAAAIKPLSNSPSPSSHRGSQSRRASRTPDNGIQREVTPPAENDEEEAHREERYSSPLPPSSPPLSPMSSAHGLSSPISSSRGVLEEVEMGMGDHRFTGTDLTEDDDMDMDISKCSSPLSFLPSSPSLSVRGLGLDFGEDEDEEGLEGAQEVPPSPSHSRLIAGLPEDPVDMASQRGSGSDAPSMESEFSRKPSPPVASTSSKPSTASTSTSEQTVGNAPKDLEASSSTPRPVAPALTSFSSISSTLTSASTSSKGKGKHVRRESEGSEKENASVKGKAKALSTVSSGLNKVDTIGVKKRKTAVEGSSSSAAVERVVKKAKIDQSQVEGQASQPKKKRAKGKEKAKDLEAGCNASIAEDEPEQQGEPSSSTGNLKQRRKGKAVDESSDSKSSKPRKRKSPSSPTIELETDPFDHQLEGMLIEILATSRASSMAVSTLCRSLLQAHPYLKDEDHPSYNGLIKNRQQDKYWKPVVARVLFAGTLEGGGSGVFGKVDSSGKDKSDRPLDPSYFYAPEQDPDADRAALLTTLMPRPGKRSETKKYKQYYWKPLGRVSRWEGEDAL